MTRRDATGYNATHNKIERSIRKWIERVFYLSGKRSNARSEFMPFLEKPGYETLQDPLMELFADSEWFRGG